MLWAVVVVYSSLMVARWEARCVAFTLVAAATVAAGGAKYCLTAVLVWCAQMLCCGQTNWLIAAMCGCVASMVGIASLEGLMPTVPQRDVFVVTLAVVIGCVRTLLQFLYALVRPPVTEGSGAATDHGHFE